VQGQILPSVNLAVGLNKISHKLGRKLQGWFIVRQRASATIYDTQDVNKTPDINLYLNSSSIATVDIFVF
jgi:hypothetical protein